jgi:hypothetical protein
MKVYPGVPHEFAEFEELETTQSFRKDLVEIVEDVGSVDRFSSL